MRPTPTARHLIAIAILFSACAFTGLLSLLDNRLSDDQIKSSTAAFKRMDQTAQEGRRGLMDQDLVFGRNGLWRHRSPVFQAMVWGLYTLVGDYDVNLPYQILAPVVTMLYLVGMYTLLYRQSRSWATSAFVAILSSTITYTIGGAYWGVGSLASVEPAGICIAATPWVVLMFLQYERRAALVLVFAFAGVMANIHAASAINLALVLLLAYLFRGAMTLKKAVISTCSVVATIIGAAPALAYQVWLKDLSPNGQMESSVGAAYRVVRGTYWQVLYPEMLLDLLTWLPLVAVLLVAAAAVLWRVERFQARDLGFWASFIVAALTVAFVFQGLCQTFGRVFDFLPPLGFVQASALVMLSLYILLAQALTNMFRILQENRSATRWGCALFALFWMLPSDNFRVLRHGLADLATSFMPENRKPYYVQKHHDQQALRDEVRAVASWARRNTSRNAVFMVETGEFRMHARRSIVASKEDVGIFYYHSPNELLDWFALYTRQRNAISSASGPHPTLVQFIDHLRKDLFAGAREWYVLLSVRDKPPAGLEPVEPQGWGRRYSLYRAVPHDPASNEGPVASDGTMEIDPSNQARQKGVCDENFAGDSRTGDC